MSDQIIVRWWHHFLLMLLFGFFGGMYSLLLFAPLQSMFGDAWWAGPIVFAVMCGGPGYWRVFAVCDPRKPENRVKG